MGKIITIGEWKIHPGKGFTRTCNWCEIDVPDIVREMMPADSIEDHYNHTGCENHTLGEMLKRMYKKDLLDSLSNLTTPLTQMMKKR